MGGIEYCAQGIESDKMLLFKELGQAIKEVKGCFSNIGE